MASAFGAERDRSALARCVYVVVALLALVPACSNGGSGGTDARPEPEVEPAPAGPRNAGPASDADGAPATAASWQPLLEPGVGGRITAIAFDPGDPDRVLVAGDRHGIGVSSDGGASWRRAAGLTGWEVGGLTWHPERSGEVWAATLSGPHVSYDGGESWALRRAGLPPPADTSYSAPIGTILVDPRDADRLLAFGADAPAWSSAPDPWPGPIWESLDGGGTWALLAHLGPGQAAADATFLADARTVLAVSRHGGVFRSEDGGRTWAAASDGLPHLTATSVEASPTHRARAWVTLDAGDGQTGGVLRSDDGGRTWAPAQDRLAIQRGRTEAETSRFATLAAAPSDPDVLYTSDLADGRRAVYRSDDGGATWARLQPPDGGFYQTEFSALAMAVAPDDPDRALVGHEESLFATDDGGRSWRDVGAVPELEGHRGTGVSGLVATSVGFARDGTLAVQGWDGAPLLARRPDGSWHAPLQDWDRRGGGYDVSIVGDSWWALLGQHGAFNGVARSTDNGLTWEVLAGGDLPPAGSALEPGPHSILGLSQATALLTMGGGLLRTDDGGSSWRAVTDAVQAALAHSPEVPHIVVGSGSDGVHRSTDGGRSFQAIGGPAGAGHLVIDGDGRIHAAVHGGEDGGVWRFQGAWRRLLADGRAAAVAVDPRDGDHLLVAIFDEPLHDRSGSDGVLETRDGGRTWQPLGTGLGVGRGSIVAFDPSGSGPAIAGTVGGGFYRLQQG